MESNREKSLWLRTAPGPRRPALAGDLDVDVAIVGGGLTGITTALLLKEAGRRVAVFEALELAGGVTGYTTAHFTELLDSRYSTLESKFGREGARLAAQSHRAAIDLAGSLVERFGIDCHYRRLPAFLYAESERDASEITREAQAARRAGLFATEVREVPLPFKTFSAVRVEEQVTLHPRRYVLALADRIPGDGSFLFENTRVLDVADGEPCRIRTERGTVTAREVIVATHAPLTKLFLQTKLAHYRSYVVTLRDAPPFADGLYFDTADPYHYLRQENVDGVNYAIVGGEDHKTGQEKDTRVRLDALLKWTRERLAGTPADHWSAQVVEPVDGLALIGRHSASEHVYVATGFSGNGMTHGSLAALLLRDLVLGRENPWTELYDPTRVKPLAAARRFVSENVDYPAHLAADRLRRGARVDGIPRGEGRIVRVGGKKLAVYRHDDGHLTAVSPVCTHMYCEVRFNTAERTWDCPCHGSRFAPDGEVIDGPAMRALERHELPQEPREERREEPRPAGDGHAPT